MEEMKEDENAKIEDEKPMVEANIEMEKPSKPSYDDVVLISQPTLSSKSTLPPDTLELR